MKRALITAAMLALASEASAQKGPITSVIAGNVADMISTEMALQRPGTREANPIMGDTMQQRLIVKSIGTAAQVWAVKVLHRKNPKAAKIVGYSIGAALGSIAVWNLQQGDRR